MDYSNIKYMHVERVGTTEVEDLLIKKVYVFPKLDGTNGVVWYDQEAAVVKAGSRKRELTLENDNAGFFRYISEQTNVAEYFQKYPDRILYGEWLVPHTIKEYREDTWRKFYVFDVGVMVDGKRTKWLPYDEYRKELEVFGITVLHPLKIVHNPTIETIRDIANTNTYLMKEGYLGEGVVCKNYNFVNRYGRTVWGKVVRNEFKERHRETMGVNVQSDIMVEDLIVNEYVTKALVDKEFHKIVVEECGWESKHIPRLLQTVYYSLVKEETWNFVKQFKSPKIDFKRLQRLTFAKVKELRSDLF